MSGVDPTKLDPILLEFGDRRVLQKIKYFGEFFPIQLEEKASGRTFLDFFQIDKETGNLKGIVKINLGSV